LDLETAYLDFPDWTTMFEENVAELDHQEMRDNMTTVEIIPHPRHLRLAKYGFATNYDNTLSALTCRPDYETYEEKQRTRIRAVVLLSESKTGRILWQHNQKKPKNKLLPPVAAVFSPDGKYLASFDGVDTLLALEIGKSDETIPIRLFAKGSLLAIAFHNIENFAIVCQEDETEGRAVYVHRESGRVIRLGLKEIPEEDEGEFFSAVLSRYGIGGKTLFVIETAKGGVTLVHAFDGETTRMLSTREYRGPQLECIQIGTLCVEAEDCIVVQLRGEKLKRFGHGKVYEEKILVISAIGQEIFKMEETRSAKLWFLMTVSHGKLLVCRRAKASQPLEVFELEEGGKKVVKRGEVKDWPQEDLEDYLPPKLNVGLPLTSMPGLTISGQDISYHDGWRRGTARIEKV
jgi:hypothetical protein